MTSIKKSLKPSSIIAYVVQELRSPSTKNKLLILVEGPDDKKLYGFLFPQKVTRVIPVGTCQYFKKILLNCNLTYASRFIIIKDADFDNLGNPPFVFSNLFRTDTHDLETMLISEESLKHLCSEYQYEKGASLLHNVLNDIRQLSFMKWYNIINHLMINFKTICIANIYDGSTPIDVNVCVNCLYGKGANSDKKKLTSTEINHFMTTHGSADPMQISNGHDICESFMVKFNQQNAGVKAKIIESSLRMFYSLKDFEKTNLYTSIVKWSRKNGFTLFK